MDALIPSSSFAKARFACLVESTQAQLYAFVRGLVGDGEEARDVVQDTYISAWKVAQHEAAPFAPESMETETRKWLFHAGYFKAISALRHRSVITWESLVTAPPLAIEEHGEARFENRVADADAVRAALATLQSGDAACLTLSIVEGFTSVEIAQILDITPEATRKRLSRAMQRLRAAYFARDSMKPAGSQSPHWTTMGKEEVEQ
jgi:RNA polymerase sigma-70 factor (ECF subfamily)